MDPEKELNTEDENTDELTKSLDDALSKYEVVLKSDTGDTAAGDAGDNPDDKDAGDGDLNKSKTKDKASNKDPGDLNLDDLNKSITEDLEGDEDSSEVLDALPFMKSLLEKQDEKFTGLIKAITTVNDRVSKLVETVEKAGGVTVAQAKLVKSIREDVKAMGNQPRGIRSQLGRNLTIVKKSENGDIKTDISKADALQKLPELVKAQKITIEEATNAESRIQKGIQLPQKIETLLVS